MKTVLVPGAPWPDPNEKRVVEVRIVKPKIPAKPVAYKKLNLEVGTLDYFCSTHNELLQPPKKSQGNPNAAKNFEKFNLRSL
jgi:hypothetical protein